MENENLQDKKTEFLYEVKGAFVTQTERPYLTAIKHILPEQYYVQPQVCLRSIIERTDNAYYQNDLYKIVDAAVFERVTFKPVLLIEINDSTHNQPKRIERDEKVKKICEEAGLPLITFWTKFAVDEKYIQKRILEGIENSKNPVRVLHMDLHSSNKQKQSEQEQSKKSQGCYIATCVYGSYDCPQVWTLRRYRDFTLSKKFFGRVFIKIYYTVSPKLVKLFGDKKWFVKLWKKHLDKTVKKLQSRGFEDTPYYDR